MREQLGGSIAVHQISEYHDQRTPLAVCAEEVERPLIAGLDHLGLEAVKRFHQTIDLIASAGRRQVTHHPTREGHQSDVISSRRRHRSEEHTSELQSRRDLVCRLLLEKKKKKLRRLFACQKKKDSTSDT